MYEQLIQYQEKNIYPMHMPGHKRNPEFDMINPYAIDMTEVENMDNLHHPDGIILNCMNRIQQRYKTKKSYILVGGSTCGILSAISACCQKGDAVLVDRGCHRSVYHAIYLLGLRPLYLMPEAEREHGFSMGISPAEVERKLAAAKQEQAKSNGDKSMYKQKISAAVITSPTYEGVVSDISAIADILHKEDIPLIVDEAHGAHFPWAHGMAGMPESAVSRGADIVVQSVHKTLPALTQTALLHLCTGLVLPEKIERYLDIYETSSPSYVLMASVDACMSYLEKCGEEAFIRYDRLLEQFRQRAAQWRTLKLWEHPRKEPSKLVICTRAGITGPELAEKLRKQYAIEVEMEAADYILAMTSVADTEEGICRFADALSEIDNALTETTLTETAAVSSDLPQQEWNEPEVCMPVYEAVNSLFAQIPLSEAAGRISAEYVMVYPPGIPFLVPGEKITERIIKKIDTAKRKQLRLLGLADEQFENIRVVCSADNPD